MEYTATEFGLAANGAQQALKDTEAYLRVMDALRQAAADARVLEGLIAWLEAQMQLKAAPWDTVNDYRRGVKAALAEVLRLQGGAR